VKKKRGRKKKRSYHSSNRGLKKLITRRYAPTDNRAKLFHGTPDWCTIRLRQLIENEIARLVKLTGKADSRLPNDYLSSRREATRQAIATGRRYVLMDEIDSLWHAWIEQCERALLDGEADWFKRQAYAIEHGDERTGTEKDRDRFEAEVMRYLPLRGSQSERFSLAIHASSSARTHSRSPKKKSARFAN
jgi:hypothetical protein